MPRFTPEKEAKILKAYDKNPNYAAVGRELGVDEKAVKSVVKRSRKGEIEKSAEARLKDSLPQNEERTKPARDELKRMYKHFLAGKRLARIVADDGFDPVDVQNENDRFLKFEGLDPHSMQEKVMTRLATLVPAQRKSKERFEELMYRFNDIHYLTGRQFDELLSMLEELSRRIGLNSVRTASMPAPDGWRRLICSNCGEALSGVIFDPNDPVGIEIEKVGRGWTHEKCPVREG